MNAVERNSLNLTLALAFLASTGCISPEPASRYQSHFISVNGVTLHYVDWGGTGEALVFLTELGGTAEGFDLVANKFTGRFHVLGLTRRGQGESDRPPSAYDVDTLVEDIRAFLDALQIKRVNLVGYSIAGNEETRFAGLYPERVAKLVYLDAAYDHASNQELLDRVRSQFSLAPLKLDDPFLRLIDDAATKFHPDYANVQAPALSFHVIYDTVPCFPAWDEATRKKLQAYWKAYGNAFSRGQMDRFRKEVRRGSVVELHGTSHTDFLTDPMQLRVVIREMRKFFAAE